MPLTHEQRVANGKKAAETRRRNRSNAELNAFIPPGSTGEFADEMRQYRAAPITHKLRAVKNPRTRKAPPFPKSYHATPTRHVPSYSAKAEQRRNVKVKPPKSPKPRKLVSLRDIRKADTATLQADFEYMTRPRSETGLKNTSANEKRYYAIKDELRARANPNLSLYLQREGIREVGGKTVRKRQVRRRTGAQKRPTRTGRRKSRSELYDF